MPNTNSKHRDSRDAILRCQMVQLQSRLHGLGSSLGYHYDYYSTHYKKL